MRRRSPPAAGKRSSQRSAATSPAPSPAAATALADYALAAVGALAEASPEALLSGHLPFPDPASYMPLAHSHAP